MNIEAALEAKANEHGHSSTRQAAQLAKTRSKTVYCDAYQWATMGRMTFRLLAECQAEFPETQIAEDYLTVRI